MSEDTIDFIAVIAVFSVFTLGLNGVAQLISNHQRYATYLEAQRKVLECRADQSMTLMDRVCGPIPTLESIK